MTPRNTSTSKAAKKDSPKAATGKASGAAKAAASAKPVAAAPAKPVAAAPAKPVIAAPLPAPAKPAVAKEPAPPGTKVMKKDLKFLEDRLLEERARLLKELGYLEANVLKQNQRDSSGDLSGYSFHMADLGTDAMEREKAFLFASAEGRALYDVDEALRRLYSGNYGVCESCGQPIAKERLEVVPHARLCIRCKEREEKAVRR